MAHISGHDRSQTLLFPESVDDSVDPDNPVRFIDAFVDGRALTAAGFVGVEPKATGRPGYAPADLLKLYIYGYLNRVRSSRRLEAETCRNIEVIWLLRHLKPDFKTIADFRRDNRAGFKPVFRGSVPGLPASRALHEGPVSHGVAVRERSRAGPDARPAGEVPGHPRSAARGGGASVRLHQAVDEPGHVPDARLRERARRVQLDGARLQSTASAQSGRAQGSAGGRGGLRGVCCPRF